MELGDADLLLFLLVGLVLGDPEGVQKVVEKTGSALGVILLDRMPHMHQDAQLELPLHLGDDQLVVQSLPLCGD